MELGRGNICRLCLEICNDNFEDIQEKHKTNLHLILLNLDLETTFPRKVCPNCEETLQKCSDFKMACLVTDNSIVQFAEKQDGIEVDLRKFYRETVPEGCNVCRFCLKITNHGFFIYFDEQLLDILLTVAMLQQYFPEMDLNATNEPVICIPCYQFLQRYFKFVIDCLTVENKINKCREAEGPNLKGFVTLSRVVYFTLHGVLEDKNQCSELNVPEMKVGQCEGGESKSEDMWSEEDDNCIKFEVKDENVTEEGDGYYEEVGNVCKDIEVKSESIVDDCEPPEEIECVYIKANIKDGNVSDVEAPHCERLEFVDINSYIKVQDNQLDGQEFSADCVTTESMEDASFCESDTLLLPIENHQEITSVIESAENCTSELITDDRKFVDATSHTSEASSYQSKHEIDLHEHVPHYKRSSEVTKYKCALCSYQSRYKNFLEEHVLVHNYTIGVKTFKCAICQCQFTSKYDLREHMLDHRSFLEELPYKCAICNYGSKRKAPFQRHMLNHRPVSEVTMLKCGICPYQSRHKDNLAKHIHKIHGNRVSEVKMLKCDRCGSWFRSKISLQRHLLNHKNDRKTHMCEFCAYQTKHMHIFERHLRIHKQVRKVHLSNQT